MFKKQGVTFVKEPHSGQCFISAGRVRGQFAYWPKKKKGIPFQFQLIAIASCWQFLQLKKEHVQKYFYQEAICKFWYVYKHTVWAVVDKKLWSFTEVIVLTLHCKNALLHVKVWAAATTEDTEVMSSVFFPESISSWSIYLATLYNICHIIQIITIIFDDIADL